MFLLEPLLSRNLESNIINAVQILLERIKAKVSRTSIKNKLTEHPDYPSLLSISDSLATWQIPSVSFKAEKESLFNLPIPFMVQIKDQGDTFFSVVSYIDSTKLIISDSISKRSFEIEWNDFMSKWTNIVMVVEVPENAVDELYLQNRKKEIIQKVSHYTGIVLVAALVVYVIISNFQTQGMVAWKGVGLLISKIFGIYVGGLLLWYEVDKKNLAIQKVCKAGRNLNCNAVLQSPLSKIFGIVSWSEIGFVYFLGGAIYLIYESLSIGSISIIRLASLCATPYVIFSLIYQWKVVKQWCVLCVTVQLILLTEVTIGLVGNSNALDLFNGINLIQVFRLAFILIGLMVLWFTLKPLINNSKESNKNKTELVKLKNNIQIFESQLLRQKGIINDNNLLGFVFGNPNATHKLIKVCNPFCGPCASTHLEIHQLLESMPDLQVQIIFTATSEGDDPRALPVKHFYAIEEEYGHDILDKALNDWYLSNEKDYNSFSKKYPVKEDFVKYNPKLDEMSTWCKINKVTYTPTIYINGFELPDMYSVTDLKHLIL